MWRWDFLQWCTVRIKVLPPYQGTRHRSTLKMQAASSSEISVECIWNVIAHGDAREGKWRRNWRMVWVASTLHTTSEHGVSSITTADAHTSAASSRLNWRPLADLSGLVRFAERRNLVSARVLSHFKHSLHICTHTVRYHIPKHRTVDTQSKNLQVHRDKAVRYNYRLQT